MNTTTQMYTQVPFAALWAYLTQNASDGAVKYIEITDIEAESLSSDTLSDTESQVRWGLY